MNLGRTDHGYYCETDETKNTIRYSSWEEFTNERNGILFRFDIEDELDYLENEEGEVTDEVVNSHLLLKLHYGYDDSGICGLSHDVIEISEDDFPEIDLFLKEKYLELKEHINNCRTMHSKEFLEIYINDLDIHLEDLSTYLEQCGDIHLEDIDTYLNTDFDLDYNLIYSYHWIDQEDGKKDLIMVAALQRHGNCNWIGLVRDITPEQEVKLQGVIDNVYMPYLLGLWSEYNNLDQDTNTNDIHKTKKR